jgi:DNA topoisomerase-1
LGAGITALPTNGLIYVDDNSPGWTRIPYGRGFSFRDETGTCIKDRTIRRRLQSLGIPPAWTEVWICPQANGYLQVTGRDEKGRKQYIYHPDWIELRQRRKFNRMPAFAERLPAIRRRVSRDLEHRRWDRQRVLALAVAVLDETGIRIGNRQYENRNGTYGLTTLRRKHLLIDHDGIHFSYKGKSGKYRKVDIENRKLGQLIKAINELPGYEVFRYRGEDGRRYPIDSADVNAYIRAAAGDEFSSKDFRTWAATAAAVTFYPLGMEDAAAHPQRKVETAVVRRVAKTIGNTPTVCRQYYIHPRVLVAVREARLPALDSVTASERARFDHELDAAECLAYRLITAK